jgi:hypothetical protein
MLRPVIAFVLATFSLAAGFHSSVAAAPPLFVECRGVTAFPSLTILVNDGTRSKVRDAVRHCREFWGGHPTGAER